MAVGATMRCRELPFPHNEHFGGECLPCCRGELPSPVHVLLLTTPLWVHCLYQRAVFDNKAQAGTALGLGVLMGVLQACLLKLRLLWLLRFQWDFALDVSFCSFAHPFISGCLVASSPAEWGAVLCSLQVSLPYFLLHPVGFGEAVGFLPPRFLALLLSEFLLFSKFAATFCSLGWKMQTSPCKLVFHLGRCDFLGGVVFCSEVSLCNSHKLFLSNLVLAWMKPAWKWERVWNCSNLGKRRRALLVSSLIFLCFLRETQFKSLHSSFVPSATGFRWSGECWFSSAE